MWLQCILHLVNFEMPFACQHRSQQEDPILLRHHKIFLSHSGAQKEFVEQLCVDLERRHRYPFFDKRPSSLPKGERFPDLIKAAVAQCKMMVVVVSEEYFTSKWPMIELNGFMQATKKDPTLKILPLFFGLNVGEFSDGRRQKKWFKKWETMAKDDKRIEVVEWKESIRWFGGFNGLVYDRDSNEVVAYRKEIVSSICKSIPSDIKYDESHVQGRSKLCQVILLMIFSKVNSWWIHVRHNLLVRPQLLMYMYVPNLSYNDFKFKMNLIHLDRMK
jgi:hypothetical protein